MCPLLSEAAARFAPSYPDVRLKFYHSSSINELAEMIHDRKIDLALSYQPNPLPALVESTKLTSVPLCLIVHFDSPLAALPRISLQAANELPLVLLEYGMYVRGCIEELAEKNDVRLQPKAEANNSNLISQMVRTGKWSSISSPEIIRQISDLTVYLL
ncbi:MAG: LysR family transcriptional regulator substrate-binding protein [Bacteroides ovatus]|nr:LysR family transcriptional regulator substrate-binding protein [Bacteroides ovatus]UYI65876.1 MAG: LysR family transcriptional regulator substrate-binding protein [Bacteroides ovatus]